MSDLKTIKLPVTIVERLAALPMEQRVAAIERGLNFGVSSIEREAQVSPSPAPAAPASVEPAAVPVVLSEQASRPAPEDWVEVTVKVHPRLKKIFESLDPQTHSAFLEFCVASSRDTEHAVKLAGMHYEFARLAMQLRKLLRVFSKDEARAPHLERRLRNAIHRWGNRVLDLVGEPLLDLPGIGLPNAPVACRDGVPSHYEPFVVWLPARMRFQLSAFQAQLVENYAGQESAWDEHYQAAFIRPPMHEKTAGGAAPVEAVEVVAPPQENPGREAAP